MVEIRNALNFFAGYVHIDLTYYTKNLFYSLESKLKLSVNWYKIRVELIGTHFEVHERKKLK